MISTRRARPANLSRRKIVETPTIKPEKLPGEVNKLLIHDRVEVERATKDLSGEIHDLRTSIQRTPVDAVILTATMDSTPVAEVFTHNLGYEPSGYHVDRVTGAFTTAGILREDARDTTTITLTAIGYDADPTVTIRVW